MKILHQVSLFILTLLFLFLVFVLAIVAFGWLPNLYLQSAIDYVSNNLEIGLVSVLLFLVGVWLLQSLIVIRKNPVQSIVQENEMGEIRVSVSAIRELVEEIVLAQPGIKKVKTHMNINEEVFKIYLRLAVNASAHIPTLSTDIGTLVSEHLEKMVGLKVDEVKILVDEISMEKKNSGTAVRVR